jgi:hypothetical protein
VSLIDWADPLIQARICLLRAERAASMIGPGMEADSNKKCAIFNLSIAIEMITLAKDALEGGAGDAMSNEHGSELPQRVVDKPTQE